MLCPETARLFLEYLEVPTYVLSAREVTHRRWGTNDDEAYLYWLVEFRETMICELWDSSRCMQIIRG